MSVRRLVALVICLVAIAPVHAAQLGEPIANFEGMPVKTLGAMPSPAQVRDAIIRAGQRREWTFVDAGPGLLIATLSVRSKHTAEVNIVYTPQSYSVSYRRSMNLKYHAGESTIHPNYNQWVAELVNNINRELSRVEGASAASAASPRPVAAPVMTATRSTPPAATNAAAPQQKPTGSAGSANAAEVSFWESVRNSKDPSEFQAYLDAYPDGIFAPLARSRLAAVKK